MRGTKKSKQLKQLKIIVLSINMIPAGDTRYPSNEIYLHPVKDGFGSTLALYLLIFTATG
ncbi:hypothetical protein FHD42_04425 [Escherichia coli]|nr:hypothetical protein [Escherichia coli]